MRRSFFKRKKAARVEASLLSFKLGYINLMITLVPFLLSIAVFSRLAVLDLHLPDLPGADPGVVSLQPPSSSPRVVLTVGIEPDGVTVSNGPERIARLPRKEGRLDEQGLSRLMEGLKEKYPDEKEVVILSRPETLYEELIAVMDACRLVKTVEAGRVRVRTLFTDVLLGEVL
jgi:hypothetical protein